MNVHNNLQGLQQLFSSQEVAQPRAKAAEGSAPERTGADEATLSAAASLAALAGPDADVRTEKVAAMQQALASGAYNVPASEVAGRLIDHMLGK